MNNTQPQTIHPAHPSYRFQPKTNQRQRKAAKYNLHKEISALKRRLAALTLDNELMRAGCAPCSGAA
jgi:hypothetical protein